MEAIALLIIVMFTLWLQKFLFNKYAFYNLDYICYFSTIDAFEGDELNFTEVIHNNKPLPLQWVKAEIRTSRWISFADTRSFIAQEIRHVTSGFQMRMYQKTTRIWKVKCLKRGVFKIDNVILVSSDFFGIITKSLPVKVNQKIIVYPAIVNLNELLHSTKSLQGDIIVKRWILDDPFVIAGAKEYSYSEPMNRIHWQATARQGNLMVRKNDYTSNQNIRIILNIQTVEYYHPNTIDKALIEFGIKISATLLDKALKLGIPVSFASNGIISGNDEKYVYTSSGNGSPHVKELLVTLSELELKLNLGFDNFLEEISPNISESEIIIITPYLEDSLIYNLNIINNRGITVKIILLNEAYKETKLNKDISVYTVKAGDLI